ncbi:MAG: gliding motility-associated ABC transporter ATP-binding subunit GldA [Cytophagales bacterium]|nr:gliding motility-associated ABC transporter ATP-binding subunit GldA [Cytophagales bacterium]
MSIHVSRLTKTYGKQCAVNDISFSVNEGEIVGFLGPNGAGKSTTMKVLTGFIPPTSGTVMVAGKDVVQSPQFVKQLTGYLAEHNPLYHDMYVPEYLDFAAAIYGLPRPSRKVRIKELVGLCGLGEEQHKKIGMLSKGYRQRVGLAQALIHDPAVLILDEPTSGLDPNQLVEIRKLIRTVSSNKTVLFSSHILQEVEALCDRVVVINRGVIVADDRLANLVRQGQHFLVVEFEQDLAAEILAEAEGVEEVIPLERKRFRIRPRAGIDLRPAIVRFAAEHNLVLLELRQEENSLESVFSQLTRTGENEIIA